MREILFRGKMKNTGEWAFGNLNITIKGTNIITPDDTPIGRYGAVFPETVGQFTGQTDKNGTKIFEGDIIKYHNLWVYTVRFDNERLGFYINDENIESSFLGNLYGERCEVIGNIHDNPELLKGESDNA